MSERPTPERALNEGLRWAVLDEEAKAAIDYMREHYGYVLVHPDDVPVADWIDWPADRNHGWNLCRAHILGEGS